MAIDPLMFATPWYMTVFTTILPWASVLRIWDVFLLTGRSFLHKVSLAILTLHAGKSRFQTIFIQLPTRQPTKKQLEKIVSISDFQDLFTYLLNIPKKSLTPEKLIPTIQKLRVRPPLLPLFSAYTYSSLYPLLGTHKRYPEGCVRARREILRLGSKGRRTKETLLVHF